MDEHPFGGVSRRRPGARQRHRGRAGARPRRHFLGMRVKTIAAMGASPAGRLQRLSRQSRDAGGGLRTPAVHADVTAVYTHTNPMRRLSRQWASRGRLCDRADGRSCRRRTRHRSGGIAPAQPDPARSDAVQIGPDLHLRLRRVRKDPRHGARARRRRGIRDAPRPIAQARQIARLRHLQHDRARRDGRLRGGRDPLRPQRHGDADFGLDHPGQGHETVFKQLVCDRLGIDPDQVHYLQGDTDKVAIGEGTGGSRSATHLADRQSIWRPRKSSTKAKAIAAASSGADADEIHFEDGIFSSPAHRTAP